MAHFGRSAGSTSLRRPSSTRARRTPGPLTRNYGQQDPIPFDDGTFDFTFAICVLHHVPPSGWSRFVHEMGRVTRPGGVVAIFEHNPWNPLTRLAVHRCEFDDDAVLVSRRRLRHLLAGPLQPLEERYIAFFPRGGDPYDRIEARLGRVPVGAQYYVAGRRPHESL